jgi:hypothetical protein
MSVVSVNCASSMARKIFGCNANWLKFIISLFRE